MREQLTSQLGKIVRAVEVRADGSFNFAGRHFSPAAQTQGHAHHFAQQQANPLLQQLEQTLYQYCYCRTFDGSLREETPDLLHGVDLTPALSEANATRERWDAGWQVYEVLPSGQVLAHKAGRTRALWPGEFLSTDGPGVAPRPGRNLSVFFARETKTMQPGFYFAFGEAEEGGPDNFSLVRLYWNVRAEGAVPLVRAATRGLNRFQIPFRFKCLTNSAFYTRHDAAVLYVDKRFYRVTARVVSNVYDEVSRHLRREAPLFAKPLAEGLALAEEPYTGESFGMQRCRILAEGLLSAHARGLRDEASRLGEVERHFAAYGLKLAAPYLNPRSVDQYEFTPAREAA
ncbi:MAG TPA: T3SS effector HopA1 family protein [Pyrinomonadaceae bacterium]